MQVKSYNCTFKMLFNIYKIFFRNSSFYDNIEADLVSKRQINDNMQAHLENILCCRMREGFIIEVFIRIFNEIFIQN